MLFRSRAGVPLRHGLREDMRVTVDGARRWHAERAWLARSAPPGGLARDVLIEARGERVAGVVERVAEMAGERVGLIIG